MPIAHPEGSENMGRKKGLYNASSYILWFHPHTRVMLFEVSTKNL